MQVEMVDNNRFTNIDNPMLRVAGVISNLLKPNQGQENDAVKKSIKTRFVPNHPQGGIKINDSRTVDSTTGKNLSDRQKMNAEVSPDLVKNIIGAANRNGIDPATMISIGLQETNYKPEYINNPFRLKNGVDNVIYDLSPTAKKRAQIRSQLPPEIQNLVSGVASRHTFDPSTPAYNESLTNDLIQFQQTNPKFNKILKKYFDLEDQATTEIQDLISTHDNNPAEFAAKVLKMKMDYANRLGMNQDEAQQLQAWNGYGKIGEGIKKGYGMDTSNLDTKTNPVYGKRIIDLRENVIKKNPEIMRMILEASK